MRHWIILYKWQIRQGQETRHPHRLHHHRQTMIRLILIILFYLLWQFGYEICTYFHPYDHQDANTFMHWEGYYYLRDRINELMLLILVAIPMFKPSRLSSAVIVGVLFSVFCSVIDKVLQNQFSEVLRDWMVILPASVFLGYLVYRRRWL